MAVMPAPTARPLMRGDVVLVPFPFTDLSSAKRRPSVVVAVDAAQGDLTLVFLSSQQVTTLGPGETALLPTHPEFVQTGLTTATKARAGKLVTLSRALILRWLGRLGPQLLAELDLSLTASLGISTIPYREQGRREERQRLRQSHDRGGLEGLLTDLGLAPPDAPP